MGDDIWYRPTRKESEWLEYVLREPPEPPPHVCGKCRNPWGVTNPDCPGRN